MLVKVTTTRLNGQTYRTKVNGVYEPNLNNAHIDFCNMATAIGIISDVLDIFNKKGNDITATEAVNIIDSESKIQPEIKKKGKEYIINLFHIYLYFDKK
jgi:hypothetical protein